MKSGSNFRPTNLINRVYKSISGELFKLKIIENDFCTYSNMDCIKSALAMFCLKHPSMLQFDKKFRDEDSKIIRNLKRCFQIDKVPSDSQMRERLDIFDPSVLKTAYTNLLNDLKDIKILDEFMFHEEKYLLNFDGVHFFSSYEVHCEHCCSKTFNKGLDNEKKLYSHAALCSVLVKPGTKVVIPFRPEPICNEQTDATKQDCEKNALNRFITRLREEHPDLKIIANGDGLFSDAPTIKLFKDHNMSFMLVAKEGDHKFLFNYIKNCEDENVVKWIEKDKKYEKKYKYLKDASINGSNQETLVNVMLYEETNIKTNKTRRWCWVTDLDVTKQNMRKLVDGARARWKIENETFNTLKNLGYHFEHNFGHGKKHLSNFLCSLMMLVFFIDQILRMKYVVYDKAHEKCCTFKEMFSEMRAIFKYFDVDSIEEIYERMVDPEYDAQLKLAG